MPSLHWPRWRWPSVPAGSRTDRHTRSPTAPGSGHGGNRGGFGSALEMPISDRITPRHARASLDRATDFRRTRCEVPGHGLSLSVLRVPRSGLQTVARYAESRSGDDASSTNKGVIGCESSPPSLRGAQLLRRPNGTSQPAPNGSHGGDEHARRNECRDAFAKDDLRPRFPSRPGACHRCWLEASLTDIRPRPDPFGGPPGAVACPAP
jgi:hypothetical protein